MLLKWIFFLVVSAFLLVVIKTWLDSSKPSLVITSISFAIASKKGKNQKFEKRNRQKGMLPTGLLLWAIMFVVVAAIAFAIWFLFVSGAMGPLNWFGGNVIDILVNK